MPIIYNTIDDRLDITYDSNLDTNGGSWDNPYTFEDFYQKDLIEGWGFITKPADNTYISIKAMNMTNGIEPLYFFSDKETIHAIDPSKTGLNFNLTIGSNLRITNTFMIFLNGEGMATFIGGEDSYINNCSFFGGRRLRPAGTMTMRNNSLTSDGQGFRTLGFNGLVDNLNTSSNGSTAARPFGLSSPVTAIFRNVFIKGPGNAAFTSEITNDSFPVIRMENLRIEGDFLDHVNIRSRGLKDRTLTFNMVDSQIDINKIKQVRVGADNNACQSFVNLLSTFDIKCNIEGASIKLYNNNDDLVLDEICTSGQVEGEVLYFRQTFSYEDNGVNQTTINEDFQPFKIIIEKQGYETSIVENINIDDGQKTSLKIDLKEQVNIMISSDGKTYIKANPKNIGQNRGFII